MRSLSFYAGVTRRRVRLKRPPSGSRLRRAGVNAVDAVVGEARRTAEDEHVAGPENQPLLGVAAPEAADVERRIVAQRDRNHRCRFVFLVFVPVRAHLGGRCIVVDQAGLGAGGIARDAVP